MSNLKEIVLWCFYGVSDWVGHLAEMASGLINIFKRATVGLMGAFKRHPAQSAIELLLLFFINTSIYIYAIRFFFEINRGPYDLLVISTSVFISVFGFGAAEPDEYVELENQTAKDYVSRIVMALTVPYALAFFGAISFFYRLFPVFVIIVIGLFSLDVYRN